MCDWGAPGVHEHDVGGGGEVEGDAAGLEGHQKHGDARLVGEGADHAVARLHAHAALQPHAPDAHLHVVYEHVKGMYA